MITQKTFAKVKCQILLPGVWLNEGAEGWLTPYPQQNEPIVDVIFEMDKVAVDVTNICKNNTEPYFFELEQIPQA